MATCIVEKKDTIYGQSLMKKQGVRTWIGMKVGFSNLDWGSQFMGLLTEHGMPCEDFTFRCPLPNLSGFREKPATFVSILHAVRLILVSYLGMSVEEACTYTLHSWRHVYITAGRQLQQPLSVDEQTEVGHWTKNSAMPARYDANTCSVELQAT